MEREPRQDALVDAFALDGAEARKPVREPPLLAAQVAEALPTVVVVRVEARVEHEPDTCGERVRAEDAVLAAVALVPAQRRRAGHGEAVRRDESLRARLPEGEVRRLDLEVSDPAPRRRRVEGPGAADDRAGELLERPREPRAPAGPRDRVGVEEDDDVAGGGVPPAVACPACIADPGSWDDPRAVGGCDLGRRILGSVVDDDHLGRLRSLIGERREDGAKGALGVERRDHDRVGALLARHDAPHCAASRATASTRSARRCP